MNKRIQKVLIKHAMANEYRYKMASAIVFKGHIVALGIAKDKTHPIMMLDGYKENQTYLHAEADAIQKALRIITPEQLARCDLYVLRVKRSDCNTKWVLGLAKPCQGCMKLIKKYGINRVFWTEKEVDFYPA